MFLHMGDVESFENYSSFFGNIWQLEYAAGQLAGHTSKTGKLGFIAAFPIPQTLLNVNAFHLGAQSVNPDIKTTFVLTSSWCAPAKQATAVQAMIESGVDVLTQHQDCTKTGDLRLRLPPGRQPGCPQRVVDRRCLELGPGLF